MLKVSIIACNDQNEPIFLTFLLKYEAQTGQGHETKKNNEKKRNNHSDANLEIPAFCFKFFNFETVYLRTCSLIIQMQRKKHEQQSHFNEFLRHYSGVYFKDEESATLPSFHGLKSFPDRS